MWHGVVSFYSCNHPTLLPCDKPNVDKVMLNRIWVKRSFFEHLTGTVPSWWLLFPFHLCLQCLSPVCGQPASAVGSQMGFCPHFYFRHFYAWPTQCCLIPLWSCSGKQLSTISSHPVFENKIQSCLESNGTVIWEVGEKWIQIDHGSSSQSMVFEVLAKR